MPSVNLDSFPENDSRTSWRLVVTNKCNAMHFPKMEGMIVILMVLEVLFRK